MASLNFNNSHTNWNATTEGFNPFNGSALGVTVTQPLRRGFGPALNRRFIRIAGNERKITSLLFQQQLINTVYGVVRLYTDFVALTEDEKVKQETLAAGREAAGRYQGAGGDRHVGGDRTDARQRPSLRPRVWT